MFELDAVDHHIQKHIIGVLIRQKYARFRDMRPPRVDTNLYSYHLKLLMKKGLVEKTSQGYTLSATGLVYVDRVSIAKLNIRSQPKIITMLVIQNADGDVLLQQRTKQPHIDTWTLPYGKLHIEDRSIAEAARRESLEKLGVVVESLSRAGDCYIRVKDSDTVHGSTLVHVFYAECDDIPMRDTLQWARPHRLSEYDLAPAVEEIVARTFFRDPYFFEEYDVEVVQ